MSTKTVCDKCGKTATAPMDTGGWGVVVVSSREHGVEYFKPEYSRDLCPRCKDWLKAELAT